MNDFLKFIKINVFLKEKNSRKDCILWSFVFSILQLSLLHSGGFVLGFCKNDYLNTVDALKNFLLTFCVVLMTELFRAIVIFALKKARFNKYVNYIFTAISFAAFNFVILLYSDVYGDSTINFVMYGFLALINSLLLTALCYKSGALASFLFSFITEVLIIIIPFKPVINEKMELFIKILLCMIFLITLDCAFSKESVGKKRNYVSRKLHNAFTMAGVAALCFVIAFICGFLSVYPVSVATGSMDPEIKIGDVVIVSKNDKDISVGDIIQFKRNGKTVIHRIISEQKQTENTVYITKGDANNTADDGYVTEDDIVGKVIYSVPKIGYLTLWLHS